ncbi:WD40-like Beta Propeller Repeat [Chitinophaga eiseniae]|uniref:WD40-like Beta Propeller Repeat n=1 Tax=Chitinophaga eiseniae TaxID=634771 RepID=A0A1T4N8J1_9BACT|nr:PD40 domain-containing protein [Chitinophaga eiseniae]SJZ75377.1 WD40-like Beta Propeller Repeat [Chitinophaga eiseniae]
MKKHLWLLFTCCCMLYCTNSKQPSQKVTVNYSTPLPDTIAQRFLPGIVSSDTLDFNATFSPDGKTFYFSRSYNRKYIIFESTHNGKEWASPVPSPLFDSTYSNTDPFFSREGDLYFISNRPQDATDTIKDYDIYKLPINRNGPGKPIRLNDINSDSTEYYVSLSDNGNIYFASYRDGNLDLYMSRKKNGHYGKPVSLGPTINSSHDEHDPLIAPDESWLIFTSGRPGGFGEADLYITFNKNGQWQQPTNMGNRINTKTYEYCPNLSPDGKFLFFSSERDVKWISSQILRQ